METVRSQLPSLAINADFIPDNHQHHLHDMDEDRQSANSFGANAEFLPWQIWMLARSEDPSIPMNCVLSGVIQGIVGWKLITVAWSNSRSTKTSKFSSFDTRDLFQTNSILASPTFRSPEIVRQHPWDMSRGTAPTASPGIVKPDKIY